MTQSVGDLPHETPRPDEFLAELRRFLVGWDGDQVDQVQLLVDQLRVQVEILAALCELRDSLAPLVELLPKLAPRLQQLAVGGSIIRAFRG